jgi:hypothetical protein
MNALAEYLPQEVFIPGARLEIEDSLYRDFRRVVEGAKNERPIQSFLSLHPKLIAAVLDGHHGHWVLPQKRFGSEHVPDFLIGDSSSIGIRWLAVELESPRAKMFTKAGDPSASLNHAIRQIQDWRSWIGDNRSYAQRKMSRGGLGLFGIRARLPAMIFLGRESSLSEANANLRAQMCEDLNVRIHSYEWLIRNAALISGNIAELIDAPLTLPQS